MWDKQPRMQPKVVMETEVMLITTATVKNATAEKGEFKKTGIFLFSSTYAFPLYILDGKTLLQIHLVNWTCKR